MVNLKNPVNGYFVLWCLYLLQGTLYVSAGMLSQLLLAAIIVISLRHFSIVVSWKNNPAYLRGLKWLVLMYTFYGVLLFLTDGMVTKGLEFKPPTYYYLKTYYMSLLPIFSCYYYSRKGYINKDLLSIWVTIFLIVAIAEYYRNQREIVATMLSNPEGVTNNIGYIMVGLMPCMLLYKKTSYQIIGLIICLLFVIFSMKRGAIVVALFVFALIVFFKIKTYKKNKNKNRFVFIAATCIILFISYHYLQETLFQNDYFNARLEETLEGNSSGRDDLYNTCWNYYIHQANIIEQIVGLGANGTLKIAKNYSHHDWLEILINQGILGILIFIGYWICFIKTIRNRGLSKESREVLILVFALTFLRTFFSMAIGDISIYTASILGFAMADGFAYTDNSKVI